MSMASTVLSGRLVSPVEKRYTNDNKAVSLFQLELDDRAPRATEAMRMMITVWGGLAESVATTLQPGMAVLLEGRLQFNTQTLPDGKKSKQLEVIANTVQYLGQFPDGQYGFVNIQPQSQGHTAPSQATHQAAVASQHQAPASYTPTSTPTSYATEVSSPPAQQPVSQTQNVAMPQEASGQGGTGMFGYFQQDLQELEDDIPF